jgi:ubiquitin conjugation factor E4 B
MLIPSILDCFCFFKDVERTGASSEFYDKFQIRYHISIIFKTLWEYPKYQHAFVKESKYVDYY